MFKTTPSLTPDQFRWLKELRSRSADMEVPEPVQGQLLTLNYIQWLDGRLVVTSPGRRAVETYRGPMAA
jgi:hypothetical protein